ncbi:MAG: sigma-54 dependent transcriptional regulator, partial [Planctomycetota bacterium]
RLPVLIQGESGTGKELAARALHEQSGSRRAAVFVSESCAALPESLIESELFGYRRGAFTGAEEDRPGIFERADGGTLFLDEIGELPLDLQSKLLRVLETGRVRRLGDAEELRVDFRLIAATNRNLEQEVAEGRFRADLLYRLDALRVEMPPLGTRLEDIPLLVEHFVRRESEHGERSAVRRVSDSVMAALCRRSWPGNVRELANEVARLCVLSEGDLVDAELVRTPAPKASGADGGIEPLEALERRAILAAIEATGDDKRQAAAALGISRAKIYQKLKAWRSRGLID